MEFSYTFLQHYWWFIISLLGALLVFLLFVQGGQSLFLFIGKSELEKKMLINSLGRKWEFTFTTLVTFGGAFFASFPLFYSTSFGGAYWVWMLILFSFVIQAVSYEFRSKANNLLGAKTYEIFLFINGVVGTILIGTAVGTFFTGAEFTVNKMNMVDIGFPTISRWANPLCGLEAAFDYRNLLLGFSVFALSRTVALLYFMNNINDDTLFNRCKKQLKFCSTLFLLLFISFLAVILIGDGYAVNENGEVYYEKYKYLWNLLEMPIVTLVLLSGVVLVLFGLYRSLFTPVYKKGIWFVGPGVVLTVLSLLLVAGWNNTAYYPSKVDLQSSLTIANSSSSYFTLQVMSIVSLAIPFVLAYIIYTWRSIDKKSIDAEEMESGGHTY